MSDYLDDNNDVDINMEPDKVEDEEDDSIRKPRIKDRLKLKRKKFAPKPVN